MNRKLSFTLMWTMPLVLAFTLIVTAPLIVWFAIAMIFDKNPIPAKVQKQFIRKVMFR